jgi:hypothetical protein
MMPPVRYFNFTKESIIEKTYRCENLPQPLFIKEGKSLPLQKGGQEGFGPRRPYYYGLIDILIAGYLDRSDVSSPITHSHEYGAPDDVPDRYREQIPP